MIELSLWDWLVLSVTAGLLLLFGCSCGALPELVQPRNDRIVWDHEPTVGTDDSDLDGDVRSSLRAWGWGVHVMGCAEADICVTRGFLDPGGPYGQALWEPYVGTECEARVNVQTWEIVAHEIGHCFGLDHSQDRRSVMWPTAREPWETSFGDNPPRHVTLSDRRVLRSIRP